MVQGFDNLSCVFSAHLGGRLQPRDDNGSDLGDAPGDAPTGPRGICWRCWREGYGIVDVGWHGGETQLCPACAFSCLNEVAALFPTMLQIGEEYVNSSKMSSSSFGCPQCGCRRAGLKCEWCQALACTTVTFHNCCVQGHTMHMCCDCADKYWYKVGDMLFAGPSDLLSVSDSDVSGIHAEGDESDEVS